MESRIGFDVEFQVETPDGSIESFKGSPTSTFKVDLASEIFAPTPSAVLTPIDKICLAGATREDCSTVSSANWYNIYAYDGYTEGYVTVTVTASADYTVTAFRAYSGAKLYFEASTSFSVVANQQVSVTMKLTISTSHNVYVYGGLPSVLSASAKFLRGLIFDILKGARPPGAYLTLVWAVWGEETIALLGTGVTRTYTPGATSGQISHPYTNFSSAGNLRYIRVNCEGATACISYVLTSAIAVTTSDRASLTITINVT